MRNFSSDVIAEQAQDAHERTLALLDGLTPQQLMGPLLATVNPLRWEIGHTAFFYEYWVLRQHFKEAPIRADSDYIYDSINIAHSDRWDLPLPTMIDTYAYLQSVLNKVKQRLSEGEDSKRDYLVQYAVFHHDMHNEAYTYTRQTLNYPTPPIGKPAHRIHDAGGLTGDAQIPGGSFMLGATEQDGFVFDNEKWGHPLEIKPFSIAKAAVSNGDYLKFVESGGYFKKEFWDDEGWQWLTQSKLYHPV